MKPRLTALDDGLAPDASRRILQQTEQALGMVPNLHRTLAHSPAALRAYAESVGALARGRLSAALREQVALTLAGANGCAYCAAAHTALGKGAGLDAAELQQNLAGESASPETAAALAFVGELLRNRGKVSDERLRAVRAAGFGDAEIVELVAHAGLNWFTNMFNVFNRTEVDFPAVELAAGPA